MVKTQPGLLGFTASTLELFSCFHSGNRKVLGCDGQGSINEPEPTATQADKSIGLFMATAKEALARRQDFPRLSKLPTHSPAPALST